jgi:hypothetical protein
MCRNKYSLMAAIVAFQSAAAFAQTPDPPATLRHRSTADSRKDTNSTEWTQLTRRAAERLNAVAFQAPRFAPTKICGDKKELGG